MSSDTFIIADAPPRRCRGCQAACPDSAKFCWMCGSPMGAEPSQGSTAAPNSNAHQDRLVRIVDDEKRDDPWTLKLAPLLAIPLVIVVIYGLFLYDPFMGWLISPALVIAALVALGHQFLVSGVAKPKGGLQRAGIAGSSVLVGLIAGVGTFAVTIIVMVVIAIVIVVSIIVAIMEFCGINVSG